MGGDQGIRMTGWRVGAGKGKARLTEKNLGEERKKKRKNFCERGKV